MFNTGAQLRKSRKRSSFTLDQLAAKSGIDRGTISRIELGHVSPRIDTLDFLCQAMNTTLADFFTADEDPNKRTNGNGANGNGRGNGHGNGTNRVNPTPGIFWPVPQTLWKGLEEVIERFEALLAHSGELFLVLDPGGKILYVSPKGETLLGFPKQELLGSAAMDLINPDQLTEFLAAFAEAAPHVPARGHFQFRHKDGGFHRFRVTLSDHLQSPSIQAMILNAALES